MAIDPEQRAHQEWLGYLQPVGLVVSPPALLAAQAHVNRNVAREQQALAALVATTRLRAAPDDAPHEAVALQDFAAFTREVLGWEPTDLVDAPEALIVALPEYGDRLAPTYAVPDPDNAGRWLMLIEVLPVGTDFDRELRAEGRRWQASPQARFERLLRENDVAIGLLVNGTALRLVYRPAGESSGHVTFPVAPMGEVAGRPILGALHMLLGAERLFSLPANQRLPHILRESRKYQNEVSTRLAEQVLEALHELLRGFQAADDAAGGALLRDVLRDAPTEVYGGLLATLLRLVFVLYAEDRGLLGGDPLYQQGYAVTGLFAKLREDAARFPDTMDQRYGAWAQLLTLFRLIHDGASHGSLRLPPRYGRLFDPDVYPFLEGRAHRTLRVLGQRLAAPKVSDGVLHRVLDRLLVLDGERLSYRALDVEQIGSVYEAMMGFRLEVATGPAIAVRPEHVVVDLGALVAKPGAERLKVLADEASLKLTGKAADAVKAAATVDALVAALDRKVSPRTPRVIPAGAMYLQPSEERRRSGSHYTPRALTEPIVRTTLRPVFEALGDNPAPAQFLALKVCDPAMGSGAFLVETCRVLGDRLVEAWQRHGATPAIPPDEDPLLHARRLVAQHCLYGVDKNPFAVDLARLSLWLVTLAKDHPFTFLDHALRQGDSLVGLTREQIASFHWEVGKQVPLIRGVVEQAVGDAEAKRHAIQALAESDDTAEKQRLLRDAEDALRDARMLGDLVIAAYFEEAKDGARKKRVKDYAERVAAWAGGTVAREALAGIARGLRERERPVTPFHWELEFPEVFSRENPGFDAMVGNPPFMGGTLIGGRLGLTYHELLIEVFADSTGLTDLVAFFLRRSFALLRTGATFGLVATNTVAQGDTRVAGLGRILRERGTIYEARRRYKWGGDASVIVSIIHVIKHAEVDRCQLDDIVVERISSFLLRARRGQSDTDPVALSSNRGTSFVGSKIWGAGFVFEESPSGGSSSLEDMHRILEADPRCAEVLSAYMGGEEFNSSPTQESRRFVIDFREMPEHEARQWPLLFRIVEDRVRPVRAVNKQRNYRENWWLHVTRVPEAASYMSQHGRVLALAKVSKHLSLSFVRAGTIISDRMILIFAHTFADFATLQSGVHEAWARFIGTTLKDDLSYTTECSDTFPRPKRVSDSALEEVGESYHAFRARLLVANNEGLTATYNRFHDPDERDAGIVKLRELHAAMDRAVLDAYGWQDLQPRCEFLLDYEEDDEGEDDGRARKRKKPWRYRWPDDVRDEVLARLIALNGERAAEEKRQGEEAKLAAKADAAAPAPKANGGGRKKKAPADEGQGGLFDQAPEDQRGAEQTGRRAR